MANELAVLGQLQITYDEQGLPMVENYQMVYDTLQAMLDNDGLVITTDELSVDSAKRISSELTKKQGSIEQFFNAEETRLKEQLDRVRQPRLELVRLFKQAQDKIKADIARAHLEWRKVAIQDSQRNCSIELDLSMFPDNEFSRLKTKKTIVEKVEKITDEIEDKYRQRLQDEEVLEQFCKGLEQNFEAWKLHLDTKPLSEIIQLINKQIADLKREEEEHKELLKAQEERKRILEAQEEEERKRALEEQANELFTTVSQNTEALLKMEDPVFWENWELNLSTNGNGLEKLIAFFQLHDKMNLTINTAEVNVIITLNECQRDDFMNYMNDNGIQMLTDPILITEEQEDGN